MARKIFRSGNSLAVTLPPETLARLGIVEGSLVEVTEGPDETSIVISPVPEESDDIDLEFARHVEEFIEQYRPALEALARR